MLVLPLKTFFFGSVSNYLCLERSSGQASQLSLSAGFNCCRGGALRPRVVHLQRKYHPVQMLQSALSAQKTPHEALPGHEKPGKELGTFFPLHGGTQRWNTVISVWMRLSFSKVLSLINPQNRLTRFIPLCCCLTGRMYAGHAVPKSDAALL